MQYKPVMLHHSIITAIHKSNFRKLKFNVKQVNGKNIWIIAKTEMLTNDLWKQNIDLINISQTVSLCVYQILTGQPVKFIVVKNKGYTTTLKTTTAWSLTVSGLEVM